MAETACVLSKNVPREMTLPVDVRDFLFPQMVPLLVLRVNLFIHLGEPVLDNFYDLFCLFRGGNIEF